MLVFMKNLPVNEGKVVLRRIPIMVAGLVLLGSEAAVAEQVTLKLSNGDTAWNSDSIGKY